MGHCKDCGETHQYHLFRKDSEGGFVDVLVATSNMQPHRIEGITETESAIIGGLLESNLCLRTRLCKQAIKARTYYYDGITPNPKILHAKDVTLLKLEHQVQRLQTKNTALNQRCQIAESRLPRRKTNG